MRVSRGAFTIEQMQPGDLDEVLRVETASFAEPWTREMFQQEMTPGVAVSLVARSDEDELWGYLCGSVVAGEFHIDNIAVDPRKRRQGVGKTLLLSALREAARVGARVAVLEVRASNLTAQALYGRFGFTVVGRRRGYYTRPTEDALIMCLDHVDEAVAVRSRAEMA
jgi:ribosomal-protein-alanine N-acetyltransferase